MDIEARYRYVLGEIVYMCRWGAMEGMSKREMLEAIEEYAVDLERDLCPHTVREACWSFPMTERLWSCKECGDTVPRDIGD